MAGEGDEAAEQNGLEQEDRVIVPAVIARNPEAGIAQGMQSAEEHEALERRGAA